MPWASDEDTNFIETPATYRSLLSAEGFEVIKERDRSDFALGFGTKPTQAAATATTRRAVVSSPDDAWTARGVRRYRSDM